MKWVFKISSIRTRLLLAFASIILVGFIGLALIAGRQISSAAQADYAQRLQNNVQLIAQGISPHVQDFVDGKISEDDLETVLGEYETQVGCDLKLYTDSVPPFSRPSFRGMVELENAMHGDIVLVERKNEYGKDTIYTAAPVLFNRQPRGLLQLSVPSDNLQAIVVQRWLELGLVFALVTGFALFAALWLARSIIQPLYKLRESAVRLSQGNFSHRVAYTGKDEIGEVAQAFNEMAQEVESMLEEQRAFASNTSHELRTPLTTIRLRTEALRYDSTLDEATAKRYIEEIDDEVARLGNLIQDLTLLSRFDAGRAELGQDQVDMLRFAASVQHQMAVQARERNIRIGLMLPEDTVFVNASINHLMVVFRNLLDNAIKYTPEGGEITWEIKKTDQGISSAIRDTGRGIDAEHLPHLFERFYRVDKARSRDIPGTGLGLALVKSIVEAYGGHITIESAGVDQGTTVNVFWPQQSLATKHTPPLPGTVAEGKV
jgi:signal transduction histidine kinase